eukprot:5981714-Amphidinium_carterae.1
MQQASTTVIIPTPRWLSTVLCAPYYSPMTEDRVSVDFGPGVGPFAHDNPPCASTCPCPKYASHNATAEQAKATRGNAANTHTHISGHSKTKTCEKSIGVPIGLVPVVAITLSRLRMTERTHS